MKLFSFIPILVFVSTISFPPSSPARSQPAAGKNSTVGRAGEIFISKDEFIRRFEMLPAPNRHRRGRLEEEKLTFLYSLIAEKLLAQEAIDRRLDRDSAFLQSYSEVRKMLARDELYREEVSRKV